MTIAERDSGLRIVSLGGGTGLSSLLAGLKAYVGQQSGIADEGSVWIETLTAVVTVTDDGGSSGRLRDEFQMLPPGDIRNCLVALAEDEHLLTRLFQYRFESDGDLSGHSFGNLFLAALTGVTGDFLEAISLSSEVLKIRGKILPSTVDDVSLVAELEGGGTLEGETRIAESRARIEKLRLSRERCRPLPETLEAISHADLITIGPGSLYTSIIPNLLVDDIVAAIAGSFGSQGLCQQHHDSARRDPGLLAGRPSACAFRAQSRPRARLGACEFCVDQRRASRAVSFRRLRSGWDR